MSTVINCRLEMGVVSVRDLFRGEVVLGETVGNIESVATSSSGRLSEHLWGRMLQDSRPFTRPVSPAEPAEQDDRHPAVRLLDQWLADESGYDEETWPQLKKALEEDRLSYRSLFRE